MTELLTAAQMRAVEQAAIASGAVTGLELMERAGQGVVDAVFEEWPELREGPRRAVVLCGPGNNGGDGFVVARLLKQQGWEVEVFLYGDPDTLPPDARVNYGRWCSIGKVGDLEDLETRSREDPGFGRYDLGMDALFGIGLSRAIDREIVRRVVNMGLVPRTVAIDIPSGLCSDSGRVLDDADPDLARRAGSLCADLTVTFHAMKCGHLLAQGPAECGKVVVKDIGIDRRLNRILGRPYDPVARRKADFSAIARLFDGETLKPGFSMTESNLDKGYGGDERHKYDHGHALILSGGVGKGGAARLAARGCLRIGAGAVTLGCPPAALIENAAQLNAVMLGRVADAGALSDLLEDDRINALCLGPGLGTGDREAALVGAALAAGRPLVLDADALTLLAGRPALFDGLHDSCVLTPHAGEFRRLFPDVAEQLAAPALRGPAYSKVDATREAARRAGCVVLFKGPDTVIAAPNGQCSVNAAAYDRAAPWLATAGSGDVLAGFIAGLLARGFAPIAAAETGAWLHVECARRFGPGLIAEDLPEALPAVFRDLGL